MNQCARWTVLVGATLLLAAGLFAAEKTQSFPASKGERLEVRVDAGEVTVRGWDKDQVSVLVQSVNEQQVNAVTMSQGGGKVGVEFRWKGGRIENMRFEISVPSAFNIDIRTGGGSLVIEAPLTGELTGSTAGGEITFGNVGGTVQMESAGGSIAGGAISGELKARTAGGEISIKSITGTGDLSTAGGTVTVGDVGKSLHVSTAGGEIQIGAVKGEIQASTAGGSINVKSAGGDASLNTAGGDIEMSSARGKVTANTSGGNIRLNGVTGSVQARSAAGDVTVTLVPSSDGASSLQTSAGNILLTVPASAHAVIRARAQGPFVGEKESSQIRSDFPFDIEEIHGPSETEKRIVLNGGGHTISLETMIGTIEIRKGK